MAEARVGVIGGSGFYAMDGLADVETVQVSTPFGDPSDAITIGTLEGQRVAFLPRHGHGHRIAPSELPVRANIWALKSLGVEFVISVSAVGSLRRKVKPLHLVIPDQLIDRTQGRPGTFFGKGLVAHVGMADPFCAELSAVLCDAADGTKGKAHRGGALVVIEGPAFSTRAESFLYRQWGARIIGMTALPEAKLAREAELCYAIVACVTDYDVWHDSEEDVTVEMIVANLQQNVKRAQAVVRAAVQNLPESRACHCATALDSAIITPLDLAPAYRLHDLEPVLRRRLAAATATDEAPRTAPDSEDSE
jgi:5'-methylthioadenosine phosphorylase